MEKKIFRECLVSLLGRFFDSLIRKNKDKILIGNIAKIGNLPMPGFESVKKYVTAKDSKNTSVKIIIFVFDLKGE